MNLENQPPSSQLALGADAEVIRYLEQAIIGGKNWYIALLEAIGLWTTADESHNGRGSDFHREENPYRRSFQARRDQGNV